MFVRVWHPWKAVVAFYAILCFGLAGGYLLASALT